MRSAARAGGNAFTQLLTGAVAQPSVPNASASPSQRSWRVTPSRFTRAAFARSIRRGKSMSHWCGGVYGQWLKHSLHCQHRSTMRRNCALVIFPTSPSFLSTASSSMKSNDGHSR